MEALYPNLPLKSRENIEYKKFFKYFPKEIFGSTDKNQFYHTKERLYALKEFKWVQYNSQDRFRVLSIDIDNSKDSLMYEDYNLPTPTWIIQTDKGFQYHWALKQDIPLRASNSNKSIKLIKDINLKLVALLDGDFNAIGLNRVFRSPCNNRTWFTGNEVELKEFYDLPVPKKDLIDTILEKNRKNKKQFNHLNEMITGSGRNCALFDILRVWAYDENRQGSYNLSSLEKKAEVLNLELQEKLQNKELNSIINSIHSFIENKYNKGYYMNLTKEQRQEVAKKNGTKSGIARNKLAFAKIETALKTMESYKIKVTIRELAKQSGTSVNTVQKYLKENK